MKVVFFLMEERNKLIRDNSVIRLNHAVPSEDIKRVSGKSDRHRVILVFYSKQSLELLQLLLKVHMNIFQGILVIVAFHSLIEFARYTASLGEFLFNFVLEE